MTSSLWDWLSFKIRSSERVFLNESHLRAADSGSINLNRSYIYNISAFNEKTFLGLSFLLFFWNCRSTKLLWLFSGNLSAIFVFVQGRHTFFMALTQVVIADEGFYARQIEFYFYVFFKPNFIVMFFVGTFLFVFAFVLGRRTFFIALTQFFFADEDFFRPARLPSFLIISILFMWHGCSICLYLLLFQALTLF